MNPQLVLSIHGAFANLLNEYTYWAQRGFASPSPHFVKQACVVRNGIPNATWIETGTFMGQTTEILATHAEKVYNIEPEPTLFKNAKTRLSDFSNVEIINGLSEEIFPILLPKVQGAVNFWLDGHHSGGQTFKGPQDTPIIDELTEISKHISRFEKTTIMVDDIRLFGSNTNEYKDYPTIDYLVDWSRSNNLTWHIEHDILIATNTKVDN